MNQFANLANHKLATQPLRDLLLLAGRPTTQHEERISASTVRAYKRMGDSFPSRQLGKDLDALYSRAFSAVDRTVFALAVLKARLTPLLPETNGRSQARTTLKTRSEASHAFRRDAAPILKLCRELLFLALTEAANQINAALKAAKKKK